MVKEMFNLAEEARRLAEQGTPVPCSGDAGFAWYSTDQEEQRAAARACGRCPLLDRCGQYALNSHELDGVWGGLTVADRKLYWNRQKRAAAKTAAAERAAQQTGRQLELFGVLT